MDGAGWGACVGWVVVVVGREGGGEGPQFDAAVHPEIAAVEYEGQDSQVAGRYPAPPPCGRIAQFVRAVRACGHRSQDSAGGYWRTRHTGM